MLDSIDIVVWDFDGVINRNYDDKGFLWHRNLEADLGVSFASLQEDLFGERWRSVLRGETQILDLLTNCLRRVGFRGKAESFLNYWMTRDFLIDPDIVAIIKQLRNLGKQQAVATNNEPGRTNLLWTEHGLCHLCQHLFSSGRMGVLKPEPAFFATVEQSLNAQPDRLLLIDDTLENVEAALERGWQATLYGDFSMWTLGIPEQLREKVGLT